MKVLHIIDSGGLYGAEIMLLHLMEEQVKMGTLPVMASIGLPVEPEKAVEAEARRRGLRVKTFRMQPGPNLAGAVNIVRFARQEKIALIHTHGYKANILFGLMPSKFRGMPTVATLHGWTWVGGFNRMYVYEWLESFSFRFADRVVLVNAGIKKHPRLRKLSRQSVVIVENGIPLHFSVDQDTLRTDIVDFTRQGFTIGAIGRLSPEKGFELLIETFAEVIAAGFDVYLVILGEGRLRKILEKKSADLGVSHRLFMPGYVSEAARYLSFFNLFVLPSFTEGLPMVLLEAMAAGVPVVATRVGGIPAVLDEGRAGVLIEPGASQGLKTAIIAAVQKPQAMRCLVEKAKQRVFKKYSSSIMAAKYQHIYQEITTERHDRPVV